MESEITVKLTRAHVESFPKFSHVRLQTWAIAMPPILKYALSCSCLLRFLKKKNNFFFLKILFLFQELDIINIGINLKSDTLVNQEIESCQRLE